MLKKILIIILIILIGVLLWEKTKISVPFYLQFGINDYNNSEYEKSAQKLSKALNKDPGNEDVRFYYVRALANQNKNTYSVQKGLFDIANSNINDDAKSFANSKIISIKKELLNGYENNYIFNAISGTDVIHWDLNTFPLKIHFLNPNAAPDYYKDNIYKGINQWMARADFVKFIETDDFSKANIVIEFKEFKSNSDCKNDDCRYTMAFTEPVLDGNTLKRMVLTFYLSTPNGEEFSPLEVYNTAIHELGHTLGIMGHSDNSDDVMYSDGDRTKDIYAQYRLNEQYISMRDLTTLALLYKLAPTITNTKNFTSEEFYYAPLFLGTNEELLNKKLVELENYIRNYPNISAGYINISSVYYNLGRENDSLKALDKALDLARNSDEKYLVHYNRAIIYVNKQDYMSALNYAKAAQSFKSSPEVKNLIQEIESLIK